MKSRTPPPGRLKPGGGGQRPSVDVDRLMTRFVLVVFCAGALFFIHLFGRPIYWRLHATVIAPFRDGPATIAPDMAAAAPAASEKLVLPGLKGGVAWLSALCCACAVALAADRLLMMSLHTADVKPATDVRKDSGGLTLLPIKPASPVGDSVLRRQDLEEQDEEEEEDDEDKQEEQEELEEEEDVLPPRITKPAEALPTGAGGLTQANRVSEGSIPQLQPLPTLSGGGAAASQGGSGIKPITILSDSGAAAAGGTAIKPAAAKQGFSIGDLLARKDSILNKDSSSSGGGSQEAGAILQAGSAFTNAQLPGGVNAGQQAASTGSSGSTTTTTAVAASNSSSSPLNRKAALGSAWGQDAGKKPQPVWLPGKGDFEEKVVARQEGAVGGGKLVTVKTPWFTTSTFHKDGDKDQAAAAATGSTPTSTPSASSASTSTAQSSSSSSSSAADKTADLVNKLTEALAVLKGGAAASSTTTSGTSGGEAATAASSEGKPAAEEVPAPKWDPAKPFNKESEEYSLTQERAQALAKVGVVSYHSNIAY